MRFGVPLTVRATLFAILIGWPAVFSAPAIADHNLYRLTEHGLVQAEASVQSRVIAQEEIDSISQQRASTVDDEPAVSTSPVEELEDPIFRLVEKASQSPPDELLSVTFEVWDSDPTLEAFAVVPLTPEERAIILEEVKIERHVALTNAAILLDALGAQQTSPYLLSSQIATKIPAGAVAAALNLPMIVSATSDQAEWAPAGAYNGKDVRDQMNTYDLISRGYDGRAGSRDPGEIIVAVIEPAWHGRANNTVPDHPGYLDWDRGPSRIGQRWVCDTSACYVGAFTPSDSPTHANWVTSLAVGSIEQDQDSSVSNSDDQIRRSGNSVETEVIFLALEVDDFAAVPRAIEVAVEEGADLVNLSIVDNTPASVCDPTWNAGGLNTTLALATNLGVLVVSAVGNEGYDRGCNIRYPAVRPQVLAVGGLHTEQLFGVPKYGETALLKKELSSGEVKSTNRGGIPISVAGERWTTSGVGLVGPGIRSLAFEGLDRYMRDPIAGTSFATPIVLGAAAVWKNSLVSQGYGDGYEHNARVLKANMLMMADRWRASDGTYDNTRVSDFSGYGRSKVYLAGSDQLGGNWAWEWGMGDLLVEKAPTSYSIPIPPTDGIPDSVTQFKMALFWEESDFEDVADITVEVFDNCSPGSLSPVRLAADITYDLNKRSAAELDGRNCLEVRVNALHLPGPRRVYFAWLYHSGDLQ